MIGYIDYISDTLFIIGVPVALYLFYKIYKALNQIRDILWYNRRNK